MKTVVLLSGGLDSAAALGLYHQRGHDIHTLTVNYGQRHHREVLAAKRIATHYGVPNMAAAVDSWLFTGSSLTTGAGEPPEGHADNPDSTFVPGRNTVLLALATAYAESIGAGNIVIGANADDDGGYPDCRRRFLESFRDTIGLGTGGKVWLSTPFLSWSKAEIFQAALRNDVPIDLTWSCYRGGDLPCDSCGACISRNEAMK